MSKINQYFASDAIKSIRQLIQEAEGNEIFLVGQVNDERLVDRVEVFARGNEYAAPALLQVARPGDVVIHNHPSGTLHPSRADLEIATNFGNDGIGFYIVNNSVSSVFVVVEPFAEKEVQYIEVESLIRLIDKNGPIANKLEKYEYRPPQITMISLLSQAINESKMAVIEAGTGTGKTLAYLLPAITFAVNNKERIVVSTNTINLQEQLIQKDLPFLNSILPQKFDAVLVKGRTNYACKRKLVEAEQDLDLFSEEKNSSELNALIAWSKTTKDGSKSDLNFEPRLDVWEKIQSESDTSLKTKCHFYDKCFFYSARRKAARADILVANHHLLFSDLAIRSVYGASENAVLPAYERIIFDEAHNIEDVATSYFGAGITYLGVLRIINRLYQRKDNQEKGLLPFISAILTKFSRGIPHEKFLQAQQFIDKEGILKIDKLKTLLNEMFESIFYTVQGADIQSYNEVKLRLTPAVLARDEWKNTILPGTNTLIQEIRRFSSKLNGFLRKLKNIQPRLLPTVSSLMVDLKAQAERLDAAARTIEFVLLTTDDENVRWIEVKAGFRGLKIIRLYSSPLDIAPIMKEAVYDNFKNVIMTSATLTVAGQFDYLKKRLGLDLIKPGKILEHALPALFDYERQTLVAIPNDIPDPRDKQFAEVLPKLIIKSIQISQGRAFVLFTSYGLLNLMFKRLQTEIESFGVNVYKQGQENRHRLLQRFKQDVTSVLFATDSFWEGVDVEGESLESIIITKLPFRVPSEPIIEARIEAIERSSGNAFLEYTVPQAAIKFRQGFGRLIRRKTDRGCVLILDKRVIQKSYGQIFLNSLPKCRFIVGTTQEIFQHEELFFKNS